MNLLPCCCGCAANPAPVPRFVNSTKVADWSSTPNPDGISPYAREKNYCSSSSCVDSASNSECGGTDQIVCWTMGFDRTLVAFPDALTGVNACAGGAFVSQILQNCYTHDGTTMLEFPSHCTYGWKAVGASVQWIGVEGFVENSVCCNDGGQGQTRYRTQTLVEGGSVSQTIGADTFDATQSINQTASVDLLGNVSRVGSMHTNSNNTVGGSPGSWLDSCLLDDFNGEAGGTSTGGETWPNGAPPLPSGSLPMSLNCGVITVGYPSGHPDYSMFPEVSGTASELNALGLFAPASGGTITSSTGNPATFVLTDTELSVSWDNVTTAPTETKSVSFSKSITLSNPRTWADVKGHAESLLYEWPLNRDDIMPWRTDSLTWLIPMMTDGAVNNSPSILLGLIGDCPSSTTWGEVVTCDCPYEQTKGGTDEIVGSPLPPGYGRHFNYWHNNEEYCASPPLCGNPCVTTVGMMGVDPLPLGATQWPTKSAGWAMPGRGAHIKQDLSLDMIPSASVYVQKYAETLVEWPAFNLARVCGRDRYLFDETAVAYINSFAAPDLILEALPAVEFEVGDKVVLNDGGVYQIATKTSATIYTVGSKLYDSPIACDGASKLRFPTARSQCSTRAVSCVQTSPGLITCTTTGKHWLKAGGSELDTLTFNGIGGLTTAAATVTSDTAFTVSGTLTTSPSSGTISDGATSAQIAFDTTCSRHTFITREQVSNYRAMAVDGDPAASPTVTQHTLTPSSRHPSVLCCTPTPNFDAFDNAYYHTWGNAFGSTYVQADMCFGETWALRFEQAVADPVWQADHRPQAHPGGDWEQAANPCDTLDDYHYAFPPLVEPLITVPSGAPSLSYTLVDTTAGIPIHVNHPNCEIDPYETPFEMTWRPGWLTCTDWQELIGHRCG